MNSRSARVTMVVIGVLALLIGAVWIGQGLSIIPGSFMSGDNTWFYIGTVVAVVGVILLVVGLRRRPRS